MNGIQDPDMSIAQNENMQEHFREPDCSSDVCGAPPPDDACIPPTCGYIISRGPRSGSVCGAKQLHGFEWSLCRLHTPWYGFLTIDIFGSYGEEKRNKMSRRGAVIMSRRKVKVVNLGFMTIGDSTPEESVIARLYAIPESKRRSVVHDLADRYGLGINNRGWGRQGYYEYIDTLIRAAEEQHLEMYGLEDLVPTSAIPERRKKLALPPIPPPNCTHTMKSGPKKGRYCGKVSVRVEDDISVCFHHTQKCKEYQRGRGIRYRAKKRERGEVYVFDSDDLSDRC